MSSGPNEFTNSSIDSCDLFKISSQEGFSPMVSINFLSKIKDNFAVIYGGKDPTVAAKLVVLKSNILKKYPRLNLWYVFDEQIQKQFPEFPLVINFETYEEYKNNFTKSQILESDPKKDILVEFCENNDVEMFVAKTKFAKHTKVAVVTKNLTTDITKKCLNMFVNNVDFNPDLSNSIDVYSTIVGKESVDLVACAARGKKVYLVENELGCNSFRKMFPDSELFEG